MNQLQQNLRYLIYTKHKTNPTRLARDTKVSQPTIKRILDGDSEEPRYSSLAKLADFFGMTVEFLRTGPVEAHDHPGAAPFELVQQSASPPAPQQETLPLTEAPALPKPSLPSGKSRVLREALEAALPESTHKNYRQMHHSAVWNMELRVDYRSERITASILAESFFTERHLWRMAVMARLLPAEKSPHDFIVFVVRENGVANRTTDDDCLWWKRECKLMGLTLLIVDSPKAVAEIIEDYENGAYEEFTAIVDESDEPDDPW